jgi:4-hydroxyphenylacetate 3-hydroxylase, reductase component
VTIRDRAVEACDAAATRPHIGPHQEDNFHLGAFRRTLGTFATGVVVVTASGQRRAGLTVNSFSSVSLDPPLVLWSLRLDAPSRPVFEDASHFAVNILAENQTSLANRFATPHPDKFAGVACVEGMGGTVLLDGCVAHLECSRELSYPGGDHLILIGRVRRFVAWERAPLVFCKGAFRSAGSLLTTENG